MEGNSKNIRQLKNICNNVYNDIGWTSCILRGRADKSLRFNELYWLSAYKDLRNRVETLDNLIAIKGKLTPVKRTSKVTAIVFIISFQFRSSMIIIKMYQFASRFYWGLYCCDDVKDNLYKKFYHEDQMSFYCEGVSCYDRSSLLHLHIIVFNTIRRSPWWITL